ncbi:Glutathione S-transferase GST-6.0 [Roseovarius gaetbuli]|uniref:Glutathione S-transferase GST-6.0 n=1 Tax=Roseovarius gaetbuli TaxID=1356575 RepID=A0A1X6ZVX4_9RHOB|nr:glutathione S-transferase family protein [Roseovarius gaetbuli]SLN63278.1 Glutathione S-transferase GST-6.0 [Roseovarius gaetbuli]
MKLYYAPKTIAIAVAITLHEAGIEYDPIRLDFRNAEQTKAEYHKVNPKGRVPALVTDRGILTETGALLDYIADLAPEAKLRPADPYEVAQVRAVMYYIASTMHVNHAHGARGTRWADQQSSIEDMKAKMVQTMTDSATFIENNVLTGPYILGDKICMADPYLFIACNWLEGDGVNVADFPKIQAFMAAMRARPSVERAVSLGML